MIQLVYMQRRQIFQNGGMHQSAQNLLFLMKAEKQASQMWATEKSSILKMRMEVPMSVIWWMLKIMQSLWLMYQTFRRERPGDSHL